MSAIARLHPRRASDMAIARPMPPAAPVTTAVRPSRRMRSGMGHCLLFSVARDRRRLKLHRAVVHTPIAHHRKVFYVILVQSPGLLRPLTRECVQGAQDIARVEVDN